MVPDDTGPTGMQTGQPAQQTGTRSQDTNVDLRSGQEIGFTQPVVMALAAGISLAVLGGLFGTLTATADGGSAAMVKTSWWFMWLGRVAVSAALVGAGLLGTRATGGMRAAFVITGTVLLFSGGAVSSLVGTFGI